MSASFAFERHWGAELTADGCARFRLWAPSLRGLTLIADATGSTMPMTQTEDGWFEVETDEVAVGQGYSFQLPEGSRVPDPAARAQIHDVHGPSRLLDPRAYAWRLPKWPGRPWEETIIYELHTGTFTPGGDFDGVRIRLDHIAKLGATAIELMPVAQFGGQRGWGYDGVLMYAPHVAYGGPEPLKHLIDAAHERGLMVLLDVVYNHFGPDGNYLHLYAPEFFHSERHTPWGAAIAYDRRPVRDFFIDNALYWLEEYRFDGLRLDAVDQIRDPSQPSILEELATAVRARIRDRHVHLTTEDDRNICSLHGRAANGEIKLYSGEWNDDFHHAAHVLCTPDRDGYYGDYARETLAKLGRALSEGYIYQGEQSAFRDGEPRGESSAHLSPTAFINFLQNHDQIGNRAFGERLATLTEPDAYDALMGVLLLSPQIPLLYMGEEWGETRPFCFFTDFHGQLGNAVREGRRNEFRKWAVFQDPANRARIPDPNALATFDASKLDWNAAQQPDNARRLALTSRLLDLRSREVVPRLRTIGGCTGELVLADDAALIVRWALGEKCRLTLFGNLSPIEVLLPGAAAHGVEAARVLFETSPGLHRRLQTEMLPRWSVVFTLSERPAPREQ